jgi:hypothetical protein
MQGVYGFNPPRERRIHMTRLQKVYRELRRYLSREDARYAAPKLIAFCKTA